jgi:hypothetical protein
MRSNLSSTHPAGKNTLTSALLAPDSKATTRFSNVNRAATLAEASSSCADKQS